MSKQFIVLLVSFLILVCISLAIMFRASERLNKLLFSPDVTVTNVPTAAVTQTLPTESYAKIITSGKPQQCSFTFIDQEKHIERKGKLFSNGNNLTALTIDEVTQDTAYTMNMIVIDKKAYTWSSLSAQGSVLDMSYLEHPVNNPAPTISPEIAALWDTQHDYACEPWIEDATKFVVPTTIKFIDATEYMNAAKTQMSCATCDTYSGEDAARCKQWLRCPY